MEGRIIAIVKTKINPNKEYRAAEKLFNSPHIQIPSSMRANTTPKDRSENILIFSPLSKFSCIFLPLTVNTNVK